MLSKQMKKFLSEEHSSQIELYEEEKEYIEKHELTPDGVTLIEKEPTTRFQEAYIEKSDKETEEMLANESFEFLKEPITYLKTHKSEFLYVESKWFELISIDAISFEVDDVFGTYSVMTGLKLPKKVGATLKTILNESLQGEEVKFELIFNQNDGLWDFNFAFNAVEGFNEELSLEEAFRLIYRFIFKLVERVELTV